jgi:hypothetical protein
MIKSEMALGGRNCYRVNTMIIDKASLLFEATGGMVYINSTGENAQESGP